MDLLIATSEGVFKTTYTALGLAALNFPTSGAQASPQTATLPKSIRTWHALTQEALRVTLAGQPIRELPPLDWTGATDFQKQVWTALLQIPVGETRSYRDVAESIGKPNATRAVGSACGANPIPVLVPCHRVLAQGGAIGGFSAGLHWKRLLLARECSLLHWRTSTHRRN